MRLGAATGVVFAVGVVMAGLAIRRGHDAPAPKHAAPPPERGRSPRPPRLVPVDGGPRFYARFASPLPSDPSFFPIGVWGQSVAQPGDVASDRAAGINTYVALPPGSDLDAVRAAQMPVIQSPGPGVGDETRGWLLSDEADMWGGPGDGPWSGATGAGTPGDACPPGGGHCGYTMQRTIARGLPRDRRVRYSNYGKGVTFWWSDAQAARFVNGFQDIVSADNYWFSDNAICAANEGGKLLAAGRALTPEECHRAANYGATVRRVRRLVSPRASKPVWALVDLAHTFPPADWPSITPAQVPAAVWHSLIAGARGIVYFNHSYGGPCANVVALRDPCYAPVRAAVAATNAQVTALAAVLNAPSVTSAWSQTPGVDAVVKWSGDRFYVLAASAGGPVVWRFSMPCIGNATATTLAGDNRSLPVRGGAFADTFADGNAVHLYRINGDSRCGL
jgi:hypothetical protein